MRSYISIILFLQLIFTYSVNAQSLKESSPAEKKILTKAVRVIRNLLYRFGDNDWELDQDWYDGRPLVPADDNGKGAFGINQNFDNVYKVNPDSKRFKNLIKPLAEKIQSLTAKYTSEIQSDEKKSLAERQKEVGKDNPVYDSIIALGNRLEELNEIDVYVYINRVYIKGMPFHDKDINVRGASAVTKLNKGYYQKDNWISYFLAF